MCKDEILEGFAISQDPEDEAIQLFDEDSPNGNSCLLSIKVRAEVSPAVSSLCALLLEASLCCCMIPHCLAMVDAVTALSPVSSPIVIVVLIRPSKWVSILNKIFVSC